VEPEGVIHFASAAAFRTWLSRWHADRDEQWVGYWKKSTGRPSMTWEESVDEALCYGWIDGIRKRLEGEAYTGVLHFDCAIDTNPVGAVPNPAVSGADGRFEVVVITQDGGGVHCVDFLLRSRTTGAVESIFGVQGEFRLSFAELATIVVEFVFTG